MKRCSRKLRSKSGIGLIFVVLIGAIIAVCLSIIYLGYQQHMKNERLLYDELTVTTAERVAKETYILDLRLDGVTYYYDAIHKSVTDASTIEGKIKFKGYGRCYESENKHAETGAIGIPNKGDNGGPQILAVCVEDDGTIHSRWQGFYLTGDDYKLMTTAERERLTTEQKNQIDSTLIYEKGKEGQKKKEMAEASAEAEQDTETETEPTKQTATEPPKEPEKVAGQ